MKHKKVEQKVLSPASGMPAKWHMVIAATLVYLSGSIFADTLEDRRSELIERISAVLPDRWHAEVVINPEKPWWMAYGDGEFTEVRLTGPNMSGYRYLLKSGKTKDVMFRYENIYLWVTASDYDDGWTLWKRMRNRFSVTYSKLPHVISTALDLKIYAIPGWVVPSGKDPSPAATLSARPIYEVSSQVTWSNWKAALTKAVR